MPVLLVIPARHASTRFPGKPLVMLRGAGGRPRSLIERSHAAAGAVRGIDRIVVATDDQRIADHVAGFGGEAVMTPESCRNGTERCAVVAEAMPDFDIVVNLQGDAPLTPPWFVEPLVATLREAGELAAATPVLRCDRRNLLRMREDRRAGRVGATTAVIDRRGRALYFSKEILPHLGREPGEGEPLPVHHHVGVYAYRRDALLRYVAMPEGELERWEGLEQLRFLENGLPLGCVSVDARGRDFWEVNNPEDVARVEAVLAELGLE